MGNEEVLTKMQTTSKSIDIVRKLVLQFLYYVMRKESLEKLILTDVEGSRSKWNPLVCVNAYKILNK